MSARDSRRAFALGSFARNGLIGSRDGVGDAGRGGGGASAARWVGGAAGRGGKALGIGGAIGRAGVAARALPDIAGRVAGAGLEAGGTRGANAAGRTGGALAGRGAAGAGRGGVRGLRGGGGTTAAGAANSRTGTGEGAAAPTGSRTGALAGATGAAGVRGIADTTAIAGGPNSSSIELPAPRMITPPHTEQRARRPVAGIFVGSTRNTERHSGQETFTSPPSQSRSREHPLRCARSPASHPCVCRSSRPSPEGSSRSSSSRSPAH